MHEHDEEQPRVVVNDRRRIDPETGQVRQPAGDEKASGDQGSAPVQETGDAAVDAQGSDAAAASDAELEAAKQEAAERTADLQRLSAEYANYRKRVDRDRLEIGKLATAKLLTDLLPVLDDLDRADAHGDLTGAFKAVADKLVDTLTKAGLAKVGAAGDVFDPALHEAVHFSTSAEVTEQVVGEVLRAGYSVEERLVRPATVVVVGPDPDAPADGSAAADQG